MAPNANAHHALVPLDLTRMPERLVEQGLRGVPLDDQVEGLCRRVVARPNRLVDAATIERLRNAKLDVTLWHEEREEELRALVALEPDGVCANTPAVLRRIVDAHRLRAPHEGARDVVSRMTG